jgi:thiamine-phosphate pyrophosphorylase
MLCLVTDRRRLSAEPGAVSEELGRLARLLDSAIDVGVDVIQIRESDVPTGVLAEFVRRVVVRATGTSTRVVVNDRADIALVSGADGVHLRGSGPPASRVRALSGDWMIGRSVHPEDPESLSLDADYLLFGTVFPSGSKGAGVPVAGLSALGERARHSRVPVLAIGGLTPARARECRAAGAAGIAAIGAFLPEGRAPGALGVAEAVRQFRRALAD